MNKVKDEWLKCAKNPHPMALMGDFKNILTDGVLSHLLTNTLRFV